MSKSHDIDTSPPSRFVVELRSLEVFIALRGSPVGFDVRGHVMSTYLHCGSHEYDKWDEYFAVSTGRYYYNSLRLY